MLDNIVKEAGFFLKCFAKAALHKYPIRSFLLLIYLIAHYVIQILLLNYTNTKLNQAFFGSTALFYLVDSTIRLVLTTPIRNSAITIGRIEYLKNFVDQELLAGDRMNFGKIYAPFKRIEVIFSGLEREIFAIVKYFPLLLLAAGKIFADAQNKFIPIVLILVNLSSILFIKKWYSIRKAVYSAEENVNKDFNHFFQNLDRIRISDSFKEWTNMSIAKEVNLYVKAMMAKHYYKLSLAFLNLILGFLVLKFEVFTSQNIISFLLFVFNWINLSLAIISLSGLLAGIQTNKKQSNICDKESNDIVITGLTINNLFDNLNLNLKFGEKLVISGANGVGKSFLLRLIARQIRNQSIVAPSNNILITNTSSIFEKEKKMLAQNEFWLENFSNKYAKLLEQPFTSHGETIFLALCTALLYNIKILLIDEVLDALSQDMLKDAFMLIDRLGVTLILVSHRQDIIDKFERNLVLDSRKLK